MALFLVSYVVEGSSLGHGQGKNVYGALFHHQIPPYYAFYHPITWYRLTSKNACNH